MHGEMGEEEGGWGVVVAAVVVLLGLFGLKQAATGETKHVKRQL